MFIHIDENGNFFISLKGKIYRTDKRGFLLNPEDWNEDWVEAVKKEEGISNNLSETHIDIIIKLREYQEKNGHSPEIKHLCNATEVKNLQKFYRLFPDSGPNGAIKMAGLRRYHIVQTKGGNDEN